MRRAAVGCVAFWLVSALFLGIGSLAAMPSAEEAESEFVGRIRDERLTAGLAEYVVASDLVAVARRHAEEMQRQQRLHHNPRLGNEVQRWESVGENVGVGPSVEEIHRMLMDSRSHRDNILHGRFTEVGVGVVVDGPDLWVVQVFRRPQAAAEPAPPAASGSASPSPPPDAASEAAPPGAPPSAGPTSPAVRSRSDERRPAAPTTTLAAQATTVVAVSTTTIDVPSPAPAIQAVAAELHPWPNSAELSPASVGQSSAGSTSSQDGATRQVTAPVALATTMLLGVVATLAAHVVGAGLRAPGGARRTSILRAWDLVFAG